MSANVKMLEEFVAGPHTTIISMTRCPFCVKAKQLILPLAGPANVKVLEIDTDPKAAAMQAGVEEKYGHDTVPAIFVKGEFVGGFSDVDAKVKAGQLKF